MSGKVAVGRHLAHQFLRVSPYIIEVYFRGYELSFRADHERPAERQPGRRIIDPKKPFRQVDIFLVNPMNFEEVHERREEMTVGGIRMAVVCMEDLIAMKSSAGRPRDFEDVDHLRKIAALRGGER